MKFNRIREPYLYGEYAIRDNRMAEVLRTDNCCGHWAVFCFINNRIVPSRVLDTPNENRQSYADAKAHAKAFLESDEPYPTWDYNIDWLPNERRVAA